jgi:alginate O-acetyltransferase complex protein AlgI
MMTLHSWTFLFCFLPSSLLLFFSLVANRHSILALGALVAISLVFASWQNAGDALLILCSALFNYVIGSWILGRSAPHGGRRWAVTMGIATNLGVLAYFKYLDYLVDNMNVVLGSSYDLPPPAFLPLGLSFLTFQQIAFLVDSFRGHVHREGISFLQYLLFCCLFPKQVAGPILRHDEFFPQISSLFRAVNSVAILEGLMRFMLGFAEKVVVADSLSSYAAPAFDAALTGTPVGSVAAWGSVLAFTFQLYFDFVGYTDMALGIARMFGFVLPENFMAPYRATSAIDFWRRWHMTLSRFLRDYLYIPMGGNRKGFARQLVNIGVTMILGGLWHGASWTFVIWGGLHGLYLGANHAWRKAGLPCSKYAGWLLTFLGVVYAWVWFRAETAMAAIRMTRAMIGLNGLWSEGVIHALRHLEAPSPRYASLAAIFQVLDISVTVDRWTFFPVSMVLSEPVLHMFWLIVSGLVVWRLPTAQEWLQRGDSHQESMEWGRLGVLFASLFFLALLVSMQEIPHTFVYAQF